MTFDDLNREYNFPGGKDVAARANAILDADQVAKDLHLMVETVPQMARFLGIKMDNTEASDSEDIARLASQKVVVYSHIQ